LALLQIERALGVSEIFIEKDATNLEVFQQKCRELVAEFMSSMIQMRLPHEKKRTLTR
jgi:hypothetical protein